ncbi:hypothetical protein Purlil1_8298 [Purpureocillium lilacinum]|uniref:Uncharacterized protein n=1 Tax=Purpureocillium lilacinum TaxID=33203 RepID=A0ABR0BTZ1_PURLI|nr:hypothetical protein Purlil1_8298 [Purpureocillium lilacinum]
MKLQLLLPFALSHVALAVPPANQALPVPTGIPNIGKYIPSGLPIRDYPGKCRRGKATMQNKLGTNIFHCEVANESIPLLNKTSKKGGISNFPAPRALTAPGGHLRPPPSAQRQSLREAQRESRREAQWEPRREAQWQPQGETQFPVMRRIMQLVLWRESTLKRETASRPGRQLQLPKHEGFVGKRNGLASVGVYDTAGLHVTAQLYCHPPTFGVGDEHLGTWL